MNVQSHIETSKVNSICPAVGVVTLCALLILLMAGAARAEFPPEPPEWSRVRDRTEQTRESNESVREVPSSPAQNSQGLYTGVALSHKASFNFTQDNFLGGTYKGRAKGSLGNPLVLGYQWSSWDGGEQNPIWGFDISFVQASGRVENDDDDGNASLTFIPFTLFGMIKKTGGAKSEDYPNGRFSGSFGLGVVYALMMADVDFGGTVGSESYSTSGIGFALMAGGAYQHTPGKEVYLNLRYMTVSGESSDWWGSSGGVEVESLQAVLGYSHNY